jgi:hypothetical protein
LARASDTEREWIWFAIRTAHCVPLDRTAYPSTLFDGKPIPWPDWACRAPDGGVHKDDRLGRIDVHVSKVPSPRDEITWTCDFTIFLVRCEWVEPIINLIEAHGTHLGNVYLSGQRLLNWVTIHQNNPVNISTNNGHSKSCPICGHVHVVFYGQVFFGDAAVVGRRLIVNGDGIFVRSDVAERLKLRAPAGAFKPRTVRYREDKTTP